jgi:alkylhydroperoxidase/carboxymuconolactone decarboxylase family protein YurZ
MATAAAALLLDSLDSEAPLVAPLSPGEAEAPVERLLAEVSGWTSTAMGRSAVPAIWRILGRNPYYLEATWRKEMALMAAGALPARDKRRVALGVAMATRTRYMIEYHAAVLRHMGDTDRDVLEVLGVVDHYTTLNTISEAMQIESDIRPPV